MSKILMIKSNNCTFSMSQYGVKLNDKSIEEIIYESLPQTIKEYKDYPAKVRIFISILGDEPLIIKTEGYSLSKEDSAVSLEENSDDDSLCLKEEGSDNAI